VALVDDNHIGIRRAVAVQDVHPPRNELETLLSEAVSQGIADVRLNVLFLLFRDESDQIFHVEHEVPFPLVPPSDAVGKLCTVRLGV
jgi:hypothetical protein